MNASLQETKHLTFKTLLLSFLIHMFILNLFIFIFPIKKAEHKPKFIFLGSMLQKRNITDTSLSTNTNQNAFNMQQFIRKEEGLKQNPFQIISPNKPKIMRPADKTQKKDIKKSYFEVDQNKKNKQPKDAYDMLKKYKETPYDPIKIENNRKPIFELTN